MTANFSEKMNNSIIAIIGSLLVLLISLVLESLGILIIGVILVVIRSYNFKTVSRLKEKPVCIGA